MSEFLSPNCPSCGAPPSIILIGVVQAIHRDDGSDCPVIMWNPSRDASQLDDAQVIDIPIND
jgi:hypothetical protein